MQLESEHFSVRSEYERSHARIQNRLEALADRRVDNLILRVANGHTAPPGLQAYAALKARQLKVRLRLLGIVGHVWSRYFCGVTLASKVLAIVVVRIVRGLVHKKVEEHVGLGAHLHILLIAHVYDLVDPFAELRSLELAHDLLAARATRGQLLRQEQRRVLALDIVLGLVLAIGRLVHNDLQVLVDVLDVECDAEQGVTARRNALVNVNVADLFRYGTPVELDVCVH